MNNFSPKMKSVMLPTKEPTLAKRLRRSSSHDSRPCEDLAILEMRVSMCEQSTKDLPSFGMESPLDEWLQQETRIGADRPLNDTGMQ